MFSEGEEQLREFSGQFLKQENFEWKEKGKGAEGCRKRVVVDGGKKKGGWYVTGDRMRQLLNGWLTDEEHDRLIRFGAGEEKIVFRCFPPPSDVSLAGPRSARDLDVRLYATCFFTSRSRSTNSILSIHLSTPVFYRTSGMRQETPMNTLFGRVPSRQLWEHETSIGI